MITMRLLPMIPLLAVAAALPAQSRWREVDLFPRLQSPGLAHDAARDRVMVFGAYGGNAAQTWLHDGQQWRRVRPQTEPTPRLTAQALAYDAARREVVLFGGSQTSAFGLTFQPLGDTWLWDGADWRLTAAVGPAPRDGHALAFDPRRGRTVLFGGEVADQLGLRQPVGDTWEWDGQNWQPSTATGPSPRRSAALAFDPASSRMVLFGGFDGQQSLRDTWSFDGTAWQSHTSANLPPLSIAPSLVTDTVRGRLLLILSDSPGAVFEWRGGQWVAQVVSTPFAARHFSGAVYVPSRDEVLCVGGIVQADNQLVGETWRLAGAAWSLRHPDVTPNSSNTLPQAVAYDRQRGRSVLTTLVSGVAELRTFEFDGSVWRQAAPASAPRSRHAQAMAYDELRQRAVLFGGNGGSQPRVLADTWLWDGTTWTQAFPAQSPSARESAHMAFDSARGRVVLFGGVDAGFSALSDTWEWDGSNWTQVAAVGPAGVGQMVYDRARQRLVLVVAVGASLQTFERQAGAWQQVATAHVPPVLYDFAAHYDEVTERVALSGGRSASVIYGETWDYDGVDWLLRDADLSPRFGHIATFDARRGRAVLYGGSLLRVDRADTLERFTDQPASYATYGRGCAGSAGVPQLASTARPWLGEAFRVRFNQLPASAVAATVTLGVSNRNWLGVPLPLSLAGLGMPGCDLLASAEFTLTVPASAGAASLALSLCACPELAGLAFYQQGFVLDASANAAGVVVSNAGAGVLGRR